ncbi:M10 family metallopeptidase C-terminal domain-containing protein, partial [Asticcacaulis sp.]|uniref:M10 family metallopeptidase C-terminal domain-containing protein n=1 Tax=Asticcacaulis sp. TaxID=1872648 RepID=UPI003F7B9183
MPGNEANMSGAPSPVVSPMTPTSPVGYIDSNFERGGYGPNGKTSLTVDQAGDQLTRDGYSLNGSGVTGTPVNITYAFRSTYGGAMPEDTSGFSHFSAAQIAATEQALAAWADVANVTFTRVGTGDSGAQAYSDNATMLFGNYSSGMSAAAAFAYYPTNNDPADIYSSDIWVNNSLAYNASPSLLNYGQMTLVHEIGHALGLEHPGDYNAGEGGDINYNDSATYYEDSRQYTVMSYFGEENTGAAYYGQYAAAPLLDDIAAIQKLYGANMNTRTGDTVYGFNSNADQAWFKPGGMYNDVIFAVWDAGGIDTFDFSGYNTNDTIDLRAGHFSSVNGLVGNVSIAEGVVIENVIGGAGNDTIIGNDANNLIDGGDGSDSIDGGAGIDTVTYANASQAVTVELSQIWAQYINSTQSYETLVNIENVIGSAYDDTLGGDAGNNTLNGGLGNDTVSYASFATSGVTVNLATVGAQDVGGGMGMDTLVSIENIFGSSHDDKLTGNSGSNVLEGNGGNDILDGAGGGDYASYQHANGGVTVSLAISGPQDVGGAMGSDTLVAIENLRGSYYNDTLTGNGGSNILEGMGGDDVLNGGGAYDTVTYISNQYSGVTVDLSLTGQQFTSIESGYDTFISIENVTGSNFDDRFYGNSGVNVIDGAGGFDYVDYSKATSGITVDLGLATSQTIGGGQGTDTLLNIENVTGSAFNDKLTGSSGNNVLEGGTGNDILDGGAGLDAAIYNGTSGVTVNLSITTAQDVGGGLGSDILVNIERLIGSSYADNLTGDSKDNSFDGGAGDDVIDGGGGLDTVTFATAYSAVTVDLTRTTAQFVGGGLGSDTYTSIENIIGTAFGDTLTAAGSTTLISAGGGDDTVTIQGKLSATAQIDGGEGLADVLWLDGDYSGGLTFGAATMTNFESLSLKGGNDYKLTLNNASVQSGSEFTIDATALGAADNMTLDGSAEADGTLIVLAGAGVDTIKTGQYDDHVIMFGDLTATDKVDGGAGYDWLYLAGDYAAGVTFNATTMKDIESLYFYQGYNYNVKLADANVAAGAQLTVHGEELSSGDMLKFDGSAETDGSFYFNTRSGTNDLSGGAQADIFNIMGSAGTIKSGGGDDVVFLMSGFTAGDKIDGGSGNDVVALFNSSYLDIVLTATTLTNVENLQISGGVAKIKTNDANVAAGSLMSVTSQSSLTFDGTAETDGRFTISGSAENDSIKTGKGADQIFGFEGNDVLNGGAGADWMYGGAGNDTYYVDNIGDLASEKIGLDVVHDTGGIDLVNSSISYTLGDYLENLSLTGSANINGTGNALNNVLKGNGANNILKGGAGADQMSGGTGNDAYYVDNLGDKVIEASGGGTDTVFSSVTFNLLGQYAENLTLTGSGKIAGSGNALNNYITGNGNDNRLDGGAGADTLIGGLGNDSYYVDNVADRVIEQSGQGTDTIVSKNYSYTLGDFIENLTLWGASNLSGTGNSLSNIITGNAGDNVLNGGGGADTLTGGGGNDTYYVDNLGDKVIETHVAGTDTVISSVTFSMGAQFI